jgi:hypothetical protein
MTAKQKSKEIYCKYADALNIRDLQITANPFVKKCALIAVDEIIEQNNVWIIQTNKGTNNYWNDVKKEINLL